LEYDRTMLTEQCTAVHLSPGLLYGVADGELRFIKVHA
jgi:hypothetical protein